MPFSVAFFLVSMLVYLSVAVCHLRELNASTAASMHDIRVSHVHGNTRCFRIKMSAAAKRIRIFLNFSEPFTIFDQVEL